MARSRLVFMEQVSYPASKVSFDLRRSVGKRKETLRAGSTFRVEHALKIQAYAGVQLLQPHPGWVELDPLVLWEQFVDVITEVIEASNLKASDVTALGISTMRGTFLTWDRQTGRPYHNFISWQDMRSHTYVESWNKSLTLKSLNIGSKFLHMILRQKKYLAGSVINFATQHASIRLHWLLKSRPELAKKAEMGVLAFGTIDSWLIWNLTKGQVHVTDYSNASSTGMFDPFVMEWSSLLTSLLNVPLRVLPKLVDTSGYICESHKDIFGAPIPVRALVADQQAAVFGQCCFDPGDVNCTMGTGSFVNINTGSYPHASVAGLYPLVGWKIGGETVYLAEGNAAGCGTAMEWAGKMGTYFLPFHTYLYSPPLSLTFCVFLCFCLLFC
ncbi:PREDICTED: putative glycerol kinase 5 [Acropora digitifera]|uniref:putative glycerol kinase 5 n=1 Tax=Acropora digitifera TaxID=70779 RepID=UPI00077A2DA9|nr:PREDICTED: putative glycerol kinase 5 [Acropora digitifera]